MTRVQRANDVNTPLAPNHLAPFTDPLDARSNLHLALSRTDQIARIAIWKIDDYNPRPGNWQANGVPNRPRDSLPAPIRLASWVLFASVDDPGG